MVDYAQLATTATRLIADFGRTVTLTKSSVTPKDAAKPWRGTTTTAAATLSTKATITSYIASQIDGELIRRGDREAWIDGASANDLTEFDTLLDGTDAWKILDVERIRPGDTIVAHRLQLRR